MHAARKLVRGGLALAKTRESFEDNLDQLNLRPDMRADDRLSQEDAPNRKMYLDSFSKMPADEPRDFSPW